MSNTYRPAVGPSGPLAYFAYTYVHGGGSHSTIQIFRELVRMTDVSAIDVYGQCAEYMADVRDSGISPIVLLPDYLGKTTIGDQRGVKGLANFALSTPHILHTAARLRRTLRQVKPRAMWVDDEKALFVAWLAVPRDLPLAYFVRTELARLKPYCIPAWKRVDAALSVSKDCLSFLDSLPARARGYAHGNLNVAYSGIDAAATVARAKAEPKGLPTRAPGVLRVTFPAVLQQHKGQDIGIRAIAKFLQAGNKVQLLLCGDIPPEFSTSFREQLVRLVHDLGLQEHVHLMGWREDMLSIMAQSDVVMLTSYVEGMPRSLLEAMTLGKPVLATRVNGTPELVRDGVDGILVEPGDIDGVVQALYTLSEPSTREQMGQAGQRRVRESFAPGQQIETFLQVMDSICGTRRSNSGRSCYVRTPL